MSLRPTGQPRDIARQHHRQSHPTRWVTAPKGYVPLSRVPNYWNLNVNSQRTCICRDFVESKSPRISIFRRSKWRSGFKIDASSTRRRICQVVRVRSVAAWELAEKGETAAARTRESAAKTRITSRRMASRDRATNPIAKSVIRIRSMPVRGMSSHRKSFVTTAFHHRWTIFQRVVPRFTNSRKFRRCRAEDAREIPTVLTDRRILNGESWWPILT